MGSPKVPALPAAPAPPPAPPQLPQALDVVRPNGMRPKAGLASTLLTSGQGAQGGTYQLKTLLGT